MEQEEVAVTRQWPGKHVSSVTNRHTMIAELLEAAFAVWSLLKLSGGYWGALSLGVKAAGA
jgi:hypothetical protein